MNEIDQTNAMRAPYGGSDDSPSALPGAAGHSVRRRGRRRFRAPLAITDSAEGRCASRTCALLCLTGGPRARRLEWPFLFPVGLDAKFGREWYDAKVGHLANLWVQSHMKSWRSRLSRRSDWIY